MIQEVQEVKVSYAQMSTTVDPKQFTFADWLAIASHLDNSPKWAFYNWEAHYGQLGGVSLAEWKQIATHLEYQTPWAYRKHDEHCSTPD